MAVGSVGLVADLMAGSASSAAVGSAVCVGGCVGLFDCCDFCDLKIVAGSWGVVERWGFPGVFSDGVGHSRDVHVVVSVVVSLYSPWKPNENTIEVGISRD